MIADLIVKARAQVILCRGEFMALGFSRLGGLHAHISAFYPFVKPCVIITDFVAQFATDAHDF